MRLRPLALVALLAAALLAGCSSKAPDHTAQVVPAHHGLAADCPQAPQATNVSACLMVLDPTARRDREASIAVDPRDARTVAVTWREGNFSDGPRIYAAVSQDGGATWRTTHLTDPSIPTLPGDDRYSFDSTARFGPDGSAYVLYGGEVSSAQGRTVVDRMTVARSDDDGSTWTYSHIAAAPGDAFASDYMDLAVAPDTGTVYVSATQMAIVPPACIAGTPGCILPEGLWVFRSTDRGASWSPPVLVHRNPPLPGVVPLPYHYLARLEAGPGGLLTMSTNGGDEPFGGHVTVSHDGGATWGPEVLVHAYKEDNGTGINDPIALVAKDGRTVMKAAYGDGGHIVGYSSEDGTHWQGPVELSRYPPGVGHVWLGASAAPDGSVYVEARAGAKDRFLIRLLHWTDSGVDTLDVLDAPVDGHWVVGDDYAAVAAAPDGTAWLAFSDLRTAPAETVAVGHVLPR